MCSDVDCWTHHSHRLRAQHLLRRQRGEIRQVGEDIDGRDDGQGYDDGARKVPDTQRQEVKVDAANHQETPKEETHLYGSIISSVTKFK